MATSRLIAAGVTANTAAADAEDFLSAAAELQPEHRSGYLARMIAGEELAGFLCSAGHEVTIHTRSTDLAAFAVAGGGRWHGPECRYDTIGWVHAVPIGRRAAHTPADELPEEPIGLLNDTEPVITHRWTFLHRGCPVAPKDLTDLGVRAAIRHAIALLAAADGPPSLPAGQITVDPDGGRLG